MGVYLQDSDLYYELVLSQGKGKLTKKAEEMFQLIADNLIRKFWSTIRETDINDCKSSGLLSMFLNWKTFDSRKFNSALPYMTEICKRGITNSKNELLQKKWHWQHTGVHFISADLLNENLY